MLLDAYLVEKAVYELSYELNNRPDWVRIPCRGSDNSGKRRRDRDCYNNYEACVVLCRCMLAGRCV